ncbi:MAG: hypothetical protein A3K10_10525 [Bacteroidetes bacterium RIFCSPLOWO2_12_FULL_31_6]|nr:MAG: hypothetical protein A3K10_10525 [Bacteroidetes bacterium RIFCSPLOWO2_12_FULL_31_6]
MIKLILHITIFPTLLLLYSCANESQDRNTMTKAAATEVESASQFEEDMGLEKKVNSKNLLLTTEQKEAFQLRAIEKFEDFIDYIKIISDQKIDYELKQHSINLALELFISDSTLFTDSILTDTTEAVPLKSFLTTIQANKNPILITIESIKFISPIAADSLFDYQGNMEVILNLHGKKLTKNVNVYLVEKKKVFGTINKEITEIGLGNIY